MMQDLLLQMPVNVTSEMFQYEILMKTLEVKILSYQCKNHGPTLSVVNLIVTLSVDEVLLSALIATTSRLTGLT